MQRQGRAALHALIVETFNLQVVRAEQTLTAGAADEQTVGHLAVDVGTPVLLLNRTTFTRDNIGVEARTSGGGPTSSATRPRFIER